MHRMSNTSSIDLSVQVVVLYRAIGKRPNISKEERLALLASRLLSPTAHYCYLLLHTYYDSGIGM